MAYEIKAFDHISETTLYELVDPSDSAVTALCYTKSVAFYVDDQETGSGNPTSGEIIGVNLYSYTDSGTSPVYTPGRFFIYRSDPGIPSGSTRMAYTGVSHALVCGFADITSTDWDHDEGGGHAFVPCSIPYPRIKTLYACMRTVSGTSTIKAAASINDTINFRLLYRKDK